MNGVMRMKRKLIIVGAVFLVLILILGGLFFWKGGHHALYLADTLEDWLDADTGAAAVTFQLQRPDYAVDPDTGRITPQIGQLSLTADGSWCEYADEPLYCLTAEGISAYFRKGIVCLDSGKAYTLPQPPDLSGTAKKLKTGLILYGRVTKEGDTYTVTMDTEELELTVLITADKTLRSISATALLPDGTALSGSVTPHEPSPAAIPQAVTDALVLAQMEPPTPLTDLLDEILPALRDLLPLSGELTLGVECGILDLAETADFRMNGKTAELERKGIIVTIDLPEEFSAADPTALALLLLRNGELTREEGSTVFRILLPAEPTNELCAALVPQIADLGVTFTESQAVLTFAEGALGSISLHADGTVPFLFSPLPVSFRAELSIP